MGGVLRNHGEGGGYTLEMKEKGGLGLKETWGSRDGAENLQKQIWFENSMVKPSSVDTN